MPDASEPSATTSPARAPFARVGAALTAQWLRTSPDEAVAVEVTEADGIGVARLRAGERRAMAAIVPLFDPADAAIAPAAAALAERLAASGEGAVLWVPPGAPLPDPADETAVSRILEAADKLRAGERSEVHFPVTLALRKVGDEGSYLSVRGGLSPHWARFTNQVMGQYQLESGAIHRLPGDADAVTQLVDYIVLVANGIRTSGRSAEARAEDAWSIQRVAGLAGAAVVAAPTDAPPQEGTAVRKALRAGMQQAIAILDASEAALKVVTFVGVFRSMEEETASIALRGLDPTTFAHFQAALLVADGQTRVVFGSDGARPGEAGEARDAV